jgi:hypothetical protein
MLSKQGCDEEGKNEPILYIRFVLKKHLVLSIHFGQAETKIALTFMLPGKSKWKKSE